MAMRNKPIRVLLVEDDEEDYLLIRNFLSRIDGQKYALNWVNNYDDGLTALKQHKHDVSIIDYLVGDKNTLDILQEETVKKSNVPIIMITGQGDREVDLLSMQAGASDFLTKDDITPSLLDRTIRHALERHHLMSELRALSMLDELTGLHNRRGFTSLASQQIKKAMLNKIPMTLILVDVDDMKKINDTLGHKEGDHALIETARILRRTFRLSDVVARIGGDEFVILALESPMANTSILIARLTDMLKKHNTKRGNHHRLRLSLGIAHFDPSSPCPIEELMDQADALMYQYKRRNKK